VDTGIAHLAGALGVKTIVIMPRKEFKCWRWKHGTWYNSVCTIEEDEMDKIPEIIRRM
jgi:ADP-heptose:LPS heptosyltransferase